MLKGLLMLSQASPLTPRPRPVPPRSKSDLGPAPTYPRVRKQDLLDEVSETEDVITRRKALERGDNLMSIFWSTVKTNTASTATKSSTTKTAAATASGSDVKHKHMSIMAAANVVQLTQLAHDAGGGIEGGDLSPETAEKCLDLLSQAKEAYEGQGFAQQAESATR